MIFTKSHGTLKSVVSPAVFAALAAFFLAQGAALAAPPAVSRQSAPVSASAAKAHAPAASAAVQQDEWQAPGAVMASLRFGRGAGEVGCSDPKDALYDFISPTSIFYKNGALFILDAPNFRILKYTAAAPGKPYAPAGAIKLWEPPASSPAKAAVEPPLFTDLAVLDNGTIFVAGSREKVIYRYDASGAPAGVIKPRVKLDGITRIWADGEKKLLIEDPFAGRIFVINQAGELIYELDLNFQPVLLPSGETVRVEYPEAAESSREISIKTYKIPAKLESASVKAVFHLPVQNFIALGGGPETSRSSRLYAYAVLGAFNDAPSEAWFVEIDLSDGAILAKAPAPVSPEMSCMRYVRAAGDGGSFIFARSSEDEYIVTKHSMAGRK